MPVISVVQLMVRRRGRRFASRRRYRRLLAELRGLAGSDDEWPVEDQDELEHLTILIASGRLAPDVVTYAPKLNAMLRRTSPVLDARHAMLGGHYGLASRGICDLVRAVSCGARAFRFVGDLDPLDLTIYCGLRAYAARFEWHGVSDVWLRAAERTNPAFTAHASMPMSSFEREHWSALRRAFGEVEAAVGPASVRLLDSGRKLELDAFLGPLGRAIVEVRELSFGRGRNY